MSTHPKEKLYESNLLLCFSNYHSFGFETQDTKERSNRYEIFKAKLKMDAF